MQRLLFTTLILAAFSAAQPAAAQSESAPATPAAPTKITSLVKIDTQIGTGELVIGGERISVNYTGWIYDPSAADLHGRKFDSSIGREPFEFVVGTHMVIRGWDQGVTGMKVGGKRTLIIPGYLAYGSRGSGDLIPPNATLVFDIELLSVK